MMDEMAIKKHINGWQEVKWLCYLGNGIDDNTILVAEDALVFMVVAVDVSWKVPC